MKKFTIIAILILSVTSFAFANTPTNKQLVEEVSMMYLNGFYNGEQDLLKKSLAPKLLKFGYWKTDDKYGDKIPMTFDAALKFAQDIKDGKRKTPKGADKVKKVEVIDVLDKIAITRVHGYWGVDYMMLAKNDGKWMIRQIIWEGPNQTANPTKADIEAVKNAGLGYIEGFYEGDESKLKNSLTPKMFKYGYGFDKKAGKYRNGGQMTYDKALEFARNVKEKKNFAKPNSPKKVEVLEVRDKIAAVKITAWWGYDYMLLSKNDNKWMIEQILWAGYPEKRKIKKSENTSIVGTWKMKEVHWKSKERTSSIKNAQTGMFIFTDNSYSIMWTPTEKPRTPFKVLSKPTNDELISGFRTVVFNAGTYQMTDNKITTTAEIAKVPGFEGGKQFYKYQINGDTLKITMYDETYPDGTKPDWSGKWETEFVMERVK